MMMTMTRSLFLMKKRVDYNYYCALLCLLVLAVSIPTSSATKHSFTLHKGSASPIGPVGIPFGFVAGGVYELNVSNFQLSVDGTGRSGGVTEAQAQEIIANVEAGFFLQRFPNEAFFQHHMEVLRSNTSLCAFESLRDDMDDVFRRQLDAGEYDDFDYDETAYDDMAFEDDFMSLYRSDDYIPPSTIDSARDGILLSMRSGQKSIRYTFQPGEDGLYFLIYQICPFDHRLRSSFELDFHFVNYDAFGRVSYLTAGEMHLPLIFFFFSVSYGLCWVGWVMNNREIQNGMPGIFKNTGGQPIVYPIHHLMSALLLFKFLATFFESLRYHAIRISGHAELWSVFYYGFTFIKGTFLFVVILLIGTGWSFVKPFLSDQEKKVVFCVLLLQVLNNIAVVVLTHLTAGETSYEKWMAMLHIVDILCCCAVLIPIIWSINAMEKSIEGTEEEGDDEQKGILRDEEEEHGDDENGHDGKEGDDNQPDEHKSQVILSKLRLFRSFYLLVVAYIYATRILVYLFATMLPYKWLWVRYFVVEIITLSFYVTVGFMFRPMAENPYLSIKQQQQQRLRGRHLRLKKSANGVEEGRGVVVKSVEMVAKKD